LTALLGARSEKLPALASKLAFNRSFIMSDSVFVSLLGAVGMRFFTDATGGGAMVGTGGSSIFFTAALLDRFS